MSEDDGVISRLSPQLDSPELNLPQLDSTRLDSTELEVAGSPNFYFSASSRNHNITKLHMRTIRHLSNNPVLKWPKGKHSFMAWYCSGSTNNELVENLVKVELIKNERVKEAMLGVSSRIYSPSISPVYLTPTQG